MFYFLIAYAIYNVIVLLMFGLDKFFAAKDKWRISEKTLLMMSFVMGAAGGFLGMFLFSHKTKKFKFRILLPLFLVINIVCIVLLYKLLLV